MKRIEPGLLVIFRYFAIIATAYFALLIPFTLRYQDRSSYMRWPWLNLIVFAGLFLYLSWGWLRKKMGGYYLPIALTISVALPFLSNLFDYFLPAERDLSSLIQRSWLLFPILVVPLVLIAWQYQFKHVILFAFLTALFEEAMLIPTIQAINLETLYVLGQPMIRSFAFGLIGQIVTHLLQIQRAQQRVLYQANLQISQHAETLEHLAISRERNRLARELHDTLAHTLSGLSVKLEALLTTVDPAQEEIRFGLDESLEVVRRGLNETRRALKALRPLALEEMGLGLAIRNYSEEIASRCNLDLYIQINETSHLPGEMDQHIYRIAQEALGNVAAHANATRLDVCLEQNTDRITLNIQDNGLGFDTQGIDRRNRFGLTGMEERAAHIGGRLEMSSQQGKGTRVHLEVNLPHD